MKKIKTFILNLALVIIGMGFLSGSFEDRSAEAARFEVVPSIQVQHLGNYIGQYLHVYYSIGSKPFLSTEIDQMSIDQIKNTRIVQITADTMTIPQVQIEKEGFRAAYNMAVFVISPSNSFYWVNTDGSIPQGITAGSSTQRSLTNMISKFDIDNFVSAQGINSAMPFTITN